MSGCKLAYLLKKGVVVEVIRSQSHQFRCRVTEIHLIFGQIYTSPVELKEVVQTILKNVISIIYIYPLQ